MKKTCIIVSCFSENQPGFLDFSYRISALAERYELTIISQFKLTQPELMFNGVDYVSLDAKGGKLGWLNYLRKAARLIRQRAPSVVVVLHSSASPISLMISDIPVCLYWNEHPSNLIHLPERTGLRYLLVKALHNLVFHGAKKADVVMPIGEEHRDELLRRGCNPAQVQLIYMGVDDRFAPVQKAAPSSDTLRLIYVGSISGPRGRDVMLSAMREVARQQLPVRLTMVGAIPDELKVCQDYIATHQLSEYVEVQGRVPGSAIPGILAEADAGICLWEDRPGWRFNPPTKLFEYLVAGLPVLASDIRTHTRYIRHADNGIIFAYEPDALALAIRDLYQMKAELPAMSDRARHDGLVHLWSKIKPEFLEVVNRVEKA